MPIPETGALVGGKLADVTGFKPTFQFEELNIERRVWLIDDVIQKGLWRSLLVDAIGETTVAFQSAIFTSEECREQGDAYGLIFTTQNAYAAISNWNSISASSTCIKAGVGPGKALCNVGFKAVGLNIPAGVTATYHFMIQGTNEDVVSREWKIRSIDEDGFTNTGSSQTADPGRQYQVFVSGTKKGPGTVSPEVWLSEGFDSSEGKVVGFGQGGPTPQF